MNKSKHPYLVIQDQIEAIETEESRLMHKRILLKLKAKELLIMCKDCNGRGSVSDSDNDGRWESYSCERCVGSGYFYPDDLFKAIKREKLERELAALDAKDTEGNQ